MISKVRHKLVEAMRGKVLTLGYNNSIVHDVELDFARFCNFIHADEISPGSIYHSQILEGR